jgi:hypothetical protein
LNHDTRASAGAHGNVDPEKKTMDQYPVQMRKPAKTTYISYETQIGKPLNERIQDVTQSYGTQETLHDVRQIRMKEQARFIQQNFI